MRRTPALSLASLTVLALAGPAVAQESSSEVCPNVAFGTTREQMTGPPDQPVTLTFHSDVQPAKTPDRWTLTRVSPGPVEVLDTRPSAPSATFTVTARETSTYRVETSGPGECGPASATFTRTVTSDTPSPPTPSPRPADCPYVEFSVDRTTIAPGDTVTVTARRVTSAPGQRAGALLRRELPVPAVVVREDSSTATVVTWALRLGESHRLRGLSRPDRSDCTPLGRPDDTPLSVDVRPAVGIAAQRDDVRTYAFTGRVLPGRGQTVALYRVDAKGRRVLTSRSRVRPDGTYRFDRRFTGSGRFGFQVDVAATESNLAGRSAVRPTVIH